MANMTLAIPDELKKKMDTHPIINWSAVARESFSQKIADLEFMKEFTSNSTLTEEDALRLGAKVNRSLAKRYRRALASKRS